MTDIVTKMMDLLQLSRIKWAGHAALGCALMVVMVVGTPGSWAAEGNTYDVRVDVASRSLDDRRAGAREGLLIVLTRLTGQIDLPDSAALRRALAAPDNYYTQFRYLRSERYDDLGNPVTVLALGFSPTAVRGLMSAAQLPLWTLNRPTVIAWVADTGGAGADLLGDPTHPLLAELAQRASYRGLPLVIPALDAQDLSEVSVADITNRRRTKLLAASERYDAQIVLIGQAEQVSVDEWRVRWHSWVDGEARRLSLSGSPSNVSHGPVDMVSDALASRFTVAGGEVGMLRLEISQVTSVADYGGVVGYLESLSYVDNVTLVGVTADGLEVDVATSSTAQKFMELLSIEARLAQQPARFTNPASQYPSPQNPRSFTDSNPDGRNDFPAGGPLAPATPSTDFFGQVLRVAWQG